LIRTFSTLAAVLVLSTQTSAAERSIRVTAPEGFLPPMKAIVVVKAGVPGPGSLKHDAIANVTKYGESLKLANEGPFDIWWQPVDGVPLKAFAALKVGHEIKELNLADSLGVVRLRGDGLPRAGLVTITTQDDAGPDEKGHVAVQKAKDYRIDMVVPEGFYAVWVTPDIGARPQKVNNRIRVQAGKVTQLD
jgi:hypothetical protein